MGGNAMGIDLSTSVENEWLCSRLVEGFGIPVANCRMETFHSQKALVVERFDRRLSSDGTWYMRLPQEDFCQATATPPALKYENDGGPGMERIMDILRGSDRAEVDRRDFMRTQLVFWLLAAVDGHAKNFSIFLQAGGAYRLAPRYDILSAYPMLGNRRGKLAPQKIRMAMAVRGKNRHYRWQEIVTRHWRDTARKCGFSGMDTVIDDVIATTPGVVDQAAKHLPRGFPDAIADTIFAGTKSAAKKLAEQWTLGRKR